MLPVVVLGRKVFGWVVSELVQGWFTKTMRSKIEPIEESSSSIEEPNLITWRRGWIVACVEDPGVIAKAPHAPR